MKTQWRGLAANISTTISTDGFLIIALKLNQVGAIIYALDCYCP